MINVLEKQCVLDLAIQFDGSVLTAFEWSLANNISITDYLAPNQKLKAPNSIFKNTDVANYFEGKNQMIATGFENNDSILPQLGIGTMTIGTTFIVG